MEVVGYAYDAAVHCPDCTKKYIIGSRMTQMPPHPKQVERWLNGEDEYEDSEGNPIHPVFDTDESGDTPEHCDDCHVFIETVWTDECVRYAVNALWDFVHESVAGGHKGNSKVLDEWDDQLSYHIGLTGSEELIRALYRTTREFEE